MYEVTKPTMKHATVTLSISIIIRATKNTKSESHQNPPPLLRLTLQTPKIIIPLPTHTPPRLIILLKLNTRIRIPRMRLRHIMRIILTLVVIEKVHGIHIQRRGAPVYPRAALRRARERHAIPTHVDLGSLAHAVGVEGSGAGGVAGGVGSYPGVVLVAFLEEGGGGVCYCVCYCGEGEGGGGG